MSEIFVPKKRRISLALALLTFLSFVSLSSHIQSQASFSGITGSLSHNVILDKYGIYTVTDTYSLTNNGSQAASVGTITLGYPANFSGHIFTVTSKFSAPGGPSFSPAILGPTLVSNVVQISVNLGSEQLAPRANATLSVAFYCQRLLTPTSSSNFSAPIPLLPSTNIPLSSASSKVSFAHDLSLADQVGFTSHSGFVFNSNSTTDYVTRSFGSGNFTKPLVNVTTLHTLAGDAGAVDFKDVRRVLSVSADGTLNYIDFITVNNYGQSQISTLTLNFPNPQPSTVTLLPVGNPPLSDPHTVSVSSGTVDIGSANDQISGGSNVTIAIQYSVPKSEYGVSGTIYTVKIPMTPPVSLADSYSIQISVPNGYIQYTPNSGTYSYVGQGLSGTYNASFRPGLAWASSSALPIASGFAFFAFLAALLVAGPAKRAEEEAAEIPKKLGGLIKVYEDKISGNLEILNEFRGKKIGEVSRASLEDARRRMDELRNRTSNRVNELRASIAVRPELGRLFNNLTNADREYDRSARDVLSIHEQYFTRRVREETYAKLLTDRTRRLERTTAALTDAVNSFQREYEK
jgi:hypothetical protein